MNINRVEIDAVTRASILSSVQLGLQSLRAEPPQSLSQWAAVNFKLAGESSHQKGAWQAWPFQIGIMDMMSDDRIEELAVQKPKRVGYTKIITAFVAYNIAHRRRKQALWQPTDDDRDSYVKSEIEPVLDGLEVVRAMRKSANRSEDTMKMKVFRDSVAHFLGGKALRNYRRITSAVCIADEWSAFDWLIEGAGDSGALMKGRLEGAPYPKFVGGSTPRIKGMCQVERARLAASLDLRYHIECHHCGAEHPLEWGGKAKRHGFKWESGNPASVHHVCPHCHGSMTQAEYMPKGQPRAGAWVCKKTGMRYGADRIWRDRQGRPARPPKSVGIRLWSAYSPQRTWESIVQEFLAANAELKRGDAGPMQVFVNETLGETWELLGDKADNNALKARAERYDLGTVPVGGLVLTASIDVQRDRWEMAVWAWGVGLESWIIDTQVIAGNPANEADWEPVTEWCKSRYVQAWHGGSLGLSRIHIDSSDQTQAVYNWVRKVSVALPVYAVKGAKEYNKPIKNPATVQEVSWRGQKLRRGVKLWTVGVSAAKDLLLGQLAIATPGPGYIHTSDQLDTEFYEQLTAEHKVVVHTSQGNVSRWIPRRPRNEQLDLRNYALHAAYCMGLHQYTDARWQTLAQAVQPERDLFSMQNTAPAHVTAEPVAIQSVAPQPTPYKPAAARTVSNPADAMRASAFRLR